MVLYMKKSFFPGTTGVFCLFFIPYMITIIFNGVDTTLINRKFDVETILPVIVAGQIGDNYELETIKAQAVIARSNLYRTVKEQKSLNSVLNHHHRDPSHGARLQPDGYICLLCRINMNVQ